MIDGRMMIASTPTAYAIAASDGSPVATSASFARNASPTLACASGIPAPMFAAATTKMWTRKLTSIPSAAATAQ